MTTPLELLLDDPLAFVLLAAALVGALGLHEYAHALAADLQGDRLPRAMGRLTPNPISHLDPMGTILIFIAGFGWAKPVEFRPQALASKRFGAAIVAIMGPMMNLLLAYAAALLINLMFRVDLGPATDMIFRFLTTFFSINVVLAVFNLIPLPPLDGSRLLTIFLPHDKQKVIFFLDKYGFIILIGLVLLGVLGRVLYPLADAVGSLLATLAGL